MVYGIVGWLAGVLVSITLFGLVDATYASDIPGWVGGVGGVAFSLVGFLFGLGLDTLVRIEENTRTRRKDNS